MISLYSSVKSPLCDINNCAKGRKKKHKRLNHKKSNNAPNQGVLLELLELFLQKQIGMSKIKQNLNKKQKNATGKHEQLNTEREMVFKQNGEIMKVLENKIEKAKKDFINVS